MNFWKGKNVFVTGGIGFLGSWLVKDLVEKGAHVVVLVGDNDPRSNFYRFNLEKKSVIIHGYLQDHHLLVRILNDYEINYVFHLAAQPIVTIANKNPFSTFESNIRGTYNLLEACRIHGKTECVVVASSDKAYGSHDKLPYYEHAPLKGEHPYDVSKSCTDLLTNCYFKTYNLPVVITRSGNFYGGGDFNFSRIVPDTVMSVINGKQPIIRSDGTFIRDYIYVKDVVDAYMKLAENIHKPEVCGHAFNISTDKKHTVLDMVNTILKVMNSNLQPVILNQVKSEIKHQYLSGGKIRNAINWEPKYDLEAGLKETAQWYLEIFSND